MSPPITRSSPAFRSMAWDPADYATHAGFVPALGVPVLALLGPVAGLRVLDLGCGDGMLTQDLVAAGAVVVGIDADPAMVAAAVARGLNARVGDGRALAVDAGFDAVFTNAALHWMGDPTPVSAGVFRALTPGGRYVGEFGGHGNVAAIRVAMRTVLAGRGYAVPAVDANYYPTAPAFRAVLEAAGFVVDACDILPRPTSVASGMAAWLHTFRAGFFDAAGVPEDAQAAVIDEIVTMLRPVLADPQGRWTADYVRLRFAARKPLDPR